MRPMLLQFNCRSSAWCRVRDQRAEIRQGADDEIGFHGALFGYAAAARVNPDASHTELLRRSHVPVEVVADHPRICGLDLEGLECPPIDALVGLSEPQLPFHENRVEQIGKLEP